MRIPLQAGLLLSALCGGTRVLAAQSDSKPHRDLGIGLRLGTLGFGLEVNKLVWSHWGARIGGNYMKFSTTKAQSDITYQASLKLQAFTGLVDFFPGRRGSFHVTSGFLTNPAKVEGTGQPTGGGALGKAHVLLSATGAANNPNLAADLQAQQEKTQHDVEKFAKVYPVLELGIGYRF